MSSLADCWSYAKGEDSRQIRTVHKGYVFLLPRENGESTAPPCAELGSPDGRVDVRKAKVGDPSLGCATAT